MFILTELNQDVKNLDHVIQHLIKKHQAKQTLQEKSSEVAVSETDLNQVLDQ